MQRIVSFVQIYVINFSYNTQNMKKMKINDIKRT